MKQGGQHGQRPRCVWGASRAQFALGLAVLAGTTLPPLATNDLWGAQALRRAPVAKITHDEAELNDPNALLRADTIDYDPNGDFVTAEGNVEINYQGQVLKADRVTYDQKKDIATADGHVALTTKDGDVIFSDHMVLTDKMRNGVIGRLGMIQVDNARVAANSGIRAKDRYTVMNKVVYSPCDLCPKDPMRAPLWQMRARRAIHDSETHDITYHNGFFEFAGVPSIYIPYISMPDPTVKRRTGFLMPSAGSKTDLGTMVTIPFYWAITPSMDLTVSPTITSQQGPVLRTEFRQRTASGTYMFDGSITEPTSRTDANTRGEGRDIRGHIFGTGFFNINDLWDWGFDVQRVTDDTYLRRYGISSLDRLQNHLYLQRTDNRDYFITNAYAFQDLRFGDLPGQSPLIAPEILTYNVLETPGIGGRLAFTGNFLSLTRLEGEDMRRVSAKVDWRRLFTTDNGQRITTFATLRTDLYYTHDVPPPGSPPGTVAIGSDAGGTTFRALPEVGVEWRWPFARMAGKLTQVVEPIAQVIYAPRGGNPSSIPNDDSGSFEFDDSNLFSDNRFPGYDVWEDGMRVNYGIRAAIYWPKGTYLEALIGQSRRFADTSPFPQNSGLDTKSSDILGRVTLSPNKYFSISERFRFDKDTFKLLKNDTEVSAYAWRFNATVVYSRLASGEAAITSTTTEAASLNVGFRINKYWKIAALSQRDLTNNRNIYQGLDVTYTDECAQIGIQLRRDYTSDRDIRPSTTVLVVFQLANLS